MENNQHPSTDSELPKPVRNFVIFLIVAVALSLYLRIQYSRALDWGVSSFKAEQYSEALRYLRPLAWMGDETATYCLILYYELELSKARSYSDSEYWMTKLPEDRQKWVARELAERYRTAYGTSVDLERASFWDKVSTSEIVLNAPEVKN